MNFTREPIIETVITPKEGYKLLIRNSKGERQEDYLVDAIEVVSFGRSFFFRSQERAKAFLLPTTDYEVIEFKETKMLSINFEKPLVGIMYLADPELKNIKHGDVVGFSPSSEYEFIIEDHRLYRVPTNSITIKYGRQRNEEEYNPSWAAGS